MAQPATTSTDPAGTIYSGPPTCCGGFSDWCANVKWLITDQFIQREKGLCCKSIDNLQLLRVKDIQYQSNCCCNCCATITIFSTDETSPILPIKGIPNGKDVYHKLRDAISQIQSSSKTQIEIKA